MIATEKQVEREVPVKPHLSPSQIESYTRCPEAYRRRYLEKEIIPPGIVIAQGKGVHKGAETNFRQKIQTHADLPAQDIIDAAVAAFEAETRGGLSFSAEEVGRGAGIVIGEAKDQTAAFAALHAEKQAPDYQPISVEREARIVLPNSTHDLLGYIDLEDDAGRVTDFKTANRRKSQSEADASVQLTYYSAGYTVKHRKPPKEVRLDVIVKNKTPVRQVLTSIRDQSDYKPLVNRVNAVLHGIKAGSFPPATPGAWWCGPEWCGYWSTCPFVNAERKTLAQIGE